MGFDTKISIFFNSIMFLFVATALARIQKNIITKMAEISDKNKEVEKPTGEELMNIIDVQTKVLNERIEEGEKKLEIKKKKYDRLREQIEKMEVENIQNVGQIEENLEMLKAVEKRGDKKIKEIESWMTTYLKGRQSFLLEMTHNFKSYHKQGLKRCENEIKELLKVDYSKMLTEGEKEKLLGKFPKAKSAEEVALNTKKRRKKLEKMGIRK